MSLVSFGAETCTSRCQSMCHLKLIFGAATKLNYDQLKSFCLTTCRNFHRLIDKTHHKTLVHVSAATGCAFFLDWLAQKVDLNAKEHESGYTPLHLAIYHGEITCVQVLLNFQANQSLTDNEGITALDMVQMDKAQWMTYYYPNNQFLFGNDSVYSVTDSVDVYSCGENVTYNLGHTRHTAAGHVVPEAIDTFVRMGVSIRKVAMSKFHSVFLAPDGSVYSCGFGQGGRLGHGDEHVQIKPKLISAFTSTSPSDAGPICIKDIAVGTNHSIFVSEAGVAYSCGNNKDFQLGQQMASNQQSHNSLEESCVTTPQPIFLSKQLRDKVQFEHCLASDHHSMFWSATETNLVYVCGANVGQMGLGETEGTFVQLPKQVVSFQNSETKIVNIHTSNYATTMYNAKGDIFLLHGFAVKKVLSRPSDLKSAMVMGCSGGDRSSSVDSTPSSDRDVRIIVNTTSGRIFVWRKSDNKLRRCVVTASGRPIYPTHIATYNNGFFALDKFGTGYRVNLTKTRDKQSGATGAAGSKKAKQNPCNTGTKASTKSSINTSSKSKLVSSSHFAFSKSLTGTQFLDDQDCQLCAVHRMPGIYRGASVFCSPNDGKSGACFLQQNPLFNLTDLPIVSESTFAQDFKTMFDELPQTDFPIDSTSDFVGNGLPTGTHLSESMLSYDDFEIPEPSFPIANNSSDHNDLPMECEKPPGSSETHNKFLTLRTRNGVTVTGHRFILMNRCSSIAQNLSKSSVEQFLDFDVEQVILELAVEYLHTGTCCLVDPGSPPNPRLMQWLLSKQLSQSLDQPQEETTSHEKQKIKHKRGRGKKKDAHAEELIPSNITGCDPVRMLHDCASRLGLKFLAKRLAQMSWNHEEMYVLRNKGPFVHDPIKFAPNAFPELADTHIKCGDGVTLHAHGCILAAQSEYFRAMLSRKWTDVSADVSLEMPISSSILRDVFTYLYTDDLPSLAFNESVDRICYLLVATDQLLLGRLREKCEAALPSMITLRNAPELLEFADTYNADALKRSAMQFICINLAHYIETNSLKDVTKECLDDLSSYYKNMLPQMSRRRVSHWSGDPNIESVQTTTTLMESAIMQDGSGLEYVIGQMEEEYWALHNYTASTAVGGKEGRQKHTSGGTSDKSGIRKALRLHHAAQRQIKKVEMERQLANSPVVDRAARQSLSPSLELDNATNDRIIARSQAKAYQTEETTDEDSGIETQFRQSQNIGLQAESQTLKPQSVELPSVASKCKVDKMKPWDILATSPESPDSGMVSLYDVMQEEFRRATLAEKEVKTIKAETFKQPITPKRTMAWASLPSSTLKTTTPVLTCPKTVPSCFLPEPSVHTDTKSTQLLQTDRKKSDSSSDFKAKPTPSRSDVQRHRHSKQSVVQVALESSFTQIQREEEEKQEIARDYQKKSIQAIQIEEEAIEQLRQFYDVDYNFDEHIVVERATILTDEPIWKAHV